MYGMFRSLTTIPGLFGRNILVGKKQLYSTCWNCVKLNNSTARLTPVTNTWKKFNQYSTQNIGNQLAKYLDEEINAEQNSSKSKFKTIPSQFNGYDVKVEGSDIILMKHSPVETIEITLNVNHSLQDTGESADVQAPEENEENDLLSKPTFQIEIKRGDTVLRLVCSYLDDQNMNDDEEYGDIFCIDELAIYKGKWEDSNYSVSGDILDGGIYDMLLGILEEKGINNDFVFELSELCTSHEHSSYVSLLKDLKKFVP